jgi:hypothetical protein
MTDDQQLAVDPWWCFEGAETLDQVYEHIMRAYAVYSDGMFRIPWSQIHQDGHFSIAPVVDRYELACLILGVNYDGMRHRPRIGHASDTSRGKYQWKGLRFSLRADGVPALSRIHDDKDNSEAEKVTWDRWHEKMYRVGDDLSTIDSASERADFQKRSEAIANEMEGAAFPLVIYTHPQLGGLIPCQIITRPNARDKLLQLGVINDAS